MSQPYNHLLKKATSTYSQRRNARDLDIYGTAIKAIKGDDK